MEVGSHRFIFENTGWFIRNPLSLSVWNRKEPAERDGFFGRRILVSNGTRFLNFCSRVVASPWSVAGVLVALIAWRTGLALSGGHLFLKDEGLYWQSLVAASDLRWGDWASALEHLYDPFWGRPAFVAVFTIPAFFQMARLGFSIPDAEALHFRSSHFHDLPALFNVLLTVFSAWVFFRLALLLTRGRRGVALLALILWSLLCNANVYVRHLFPYDLSLLFLLLAACVLLKVGEEQRRAPVVGGGALAGILCGLSFSAYQGYYLFVPVLGMVVLVAFRRRWLGAAVFSMGFWGVILLWEVIGDLLAREALGRVHGVSSYLALCRKVGSLISLGDYGEAFVFLPRYLGRVEGPIGWVLLLGGFVFLVRVWPCLSRVPRTFFAALLGVYLFHAAWGYFGHGMVLYARLLHLYLPFLALAAAWAVGGCGQPAWRWGVGVAVVAVSVGSFVGWAAPYARLCYPTEFVNRFVPPSTAPERRLDLSEARGMLVTPDWSRWEVVTVNVAQFDIREAAPETQVFPTLQPVGEGWRQVAERPHPFNFPAYQFEGLLEGNRERIRRTNFQMKVFTRNSLCGEAPSQ